MALISLVNWAIAATLAPVVAVLIRLIVNTSHGIPGPVLARVTDLWYLYHVYRGDFEKTNIDLHEKYGPVVRYGPNRFSFKHPHATEAIYSRLGSKFAKSSWYSTWADPGKWSIFADQSIQRHAQTRRLFQNAYSMSTLMSYEPFVDQCSKILDTRLRECAGSSRALDARHWFQCYAFDVIGLMTYGERFGFLDKGHDVGGIIRALEQHLPYATIVGIYAWLHPLCYRLLNMIRGGSGSGREHLLQYSNARITEQSEAGGSKSLEQEAAGGTSSADTFLSKFLEKNAQEPTRFTRHHILMGCTSNMVAGSDTTAISLSAVFYHLLKSPHSYAALKDEVDSLHRQGKLSASPTFSETQNMPYLQAVIKEALRMHPATGLPLERVVPEGGLTLAGHYFAPGSIVGVNSWVEHYDPTVFGDDAHQFRPERWQTTDTEMLKLMNQHWMPFGLGSRTCIGRHISMLEMSKLVPRLVRDFEFQLDKRHETTPWPTTAYWFVKPTTFLINVQERPKTEGN